MLLFRPHADQLGHSLLGLSLTLLFAFCATPGQAAPMSFNCSG
jgi:hypothetical protein